MQGRPHDRPSGYRLPQLLAQHAANDKRRRIPQDAFYRRSLASSPEIARRFEHTSVDQLIRMLSIQMVAKYYQARQPDLRLEVETAYYEHWSASLVRVDAICDPEFDGTTWTA